MFRIEYTNYDSGVSFKVIDNVTSMTYFKADGKIVLQVVADKVFTPFWVEFYPSDDVVIDIVPVQG